MEGFNGELNYKITVDEEQLRGREIQKTILNKMLEHKYQSEELESMKAVFVAEFKYNEELYKENDRLRAAIEKFIALEEHYVNYEGPAIHILEDALNGKD